MHYRAQQIFSFLLLALILTVFCTSSVWASETQENNNGPEAEIPSSISPEDSKTNPLSDDIAYWFQEIRYELAPVDQEPVSGVHIRPVYIREGLKVQFDFGFYQNPWNKSWQWGKPERGTASEIPNFIDSAVYKGDNLEIGYDAVSGMKWGYGLLFYDYHPSRPIRGLILRLQPVSGMAFTIIEPAEIRSFQPYVSDSCASLEMFRWQNEMNFNKSAWRFGLTVLRENNTLLPANYPRQAYSFDLAYKKGTGLGPFLEAARLVDFGDGLLAGLSGRYISMEYQVGVFRTQGRFLPNFFGGFYEDRKRNTVGGTGDRLPDLHSDRYGFRDGYLGRLSLNVSKFFDLGMLYINDPVITGGTLGVSLTGQLYRIRMNYGFFYYGQNGESPSCQWFIQGSRGIYDYGYRHYVEEQSGRDVIFVDVRL